jgi:hypothetical protein
MYFWEESTPLQTSGPFNVKSPGRLNVAAGRDLNNCHALQISLVPRHVPMNGHRILSQVRDKD